MGPDHLMQGRYIDIIIISLVVSFFFCCVLILYLQEGDNIFRTKYCPSLFHDFKMGGYNTTKSFVTVGW